MAVVTAVVVAVFGGLTLWLQDETFIKMKPTIVNAVFAAILGFGLLQGRSYLRYLMGEAMPLTDRGWMIFTQRWVMFFVICAVLNEIVWRTQTTEFWVSFKTFFYLPLTFAFVALHWSFLQRHAVESPGHRVAPAGRNVGQRHEDEGPFVHPRVRQDEFARRLGGRRLGRERHPALHRRAVGQDEVAHADKVEIADARPPAHRARPAEPGLDPVQPRQQRIGGKPRPERGGAVDEIGAAAGWPGRRAVPPGDRADRRAGDRVDQRQRSPQG
jgi:intracellular septation protein A